MILNGLMFYNGELYLQGVKNTYDKCILCLFVIEGCNTFLYNTYYNTYNGILMIYGFLSFILSLSVMRIGVSL